MESDKLLGEIDDSVNWIYVTWRQKALVTPATTKMHNRIDQNVLDYAKTINWTSHETNARPVL